MVSREYYIYNNIAAPASSDLTTFDLAFFTCIFSFNHAITYYGKNLYLGQMHYFLISSHIIDNICVNNLYLRDHSPEASVKKKKDWSLKGLLYAIII